MSKKFLAIQLTVFLSLLAFAPNFTLAQEKLELVYFWGQGCPHCAKELGFLLIFKPGLLMFG